MTEQHEPTDDVQGHFRREETIADDVQGHKIPRADDADTDDDVQGHLKR